VETAYAETKLYRAPTSYSPGHTRGSAAFVFEELGLVFTGDALVTIDDLTGGIGPRMLCRAFTQNSQQAPGSLDRLSHVTADLLLLAVAGATQRVDRPESEGERGDVNRHVDAQRQLLGGEHDSQTDTREQSAGHDQLLGLRSRDRQRQTQHAGRQQPNRTTNPERLLQQHESTDPMRASAPRRTRSRCSIEVVFIARSDVPPVGKVGRWSSMRWR